MHCVTLADLAAALSQHGPQILRHYSDLPAETLVRYWTASRNRLEHWHQILSLFRDAERTDNWKQMIEWWNGHNSVMEEILVSEMLTRIVAAIGAGIDQRHCTDQRHYTVNTLQQDDDSVSNSTPTHLADSPQGGPPGSEKDSSRDDVLPILHGVFLSHLEASNRVHQLMLDRRGSDVTHLVRLNRLRQGVQRWTDVLIGRLSIDSPRQFDYSFDPKRAHHFADETRQYGTDQYRETSFWLIAAVMRDMLCKRTREHATNPEHNRNIAESVLRMFRPELFDSAGFPKSLLTLRLQLESPADQHQSTNSALA